MAYTVSDLLIRPRASAGNEILRVDMSASRFEYLTFSVRAPKQGASFRGQTDSTELCIVMLGGTCSIESSAGTWRHVGKRPNVFAGMPYAVYLPIHTEYTVSAETDCELALCSSRAEKIMQVSKRLSCSTPAAEPLRQPGVWKSRERATRRLCSIAGRCSLQGV